MRRLLSLLLAAVALQGCATFAESTHQEVQVLTPGVVGAECTLQTEINKYVAITPVRVQVQRSPETLEVVCKKAHYKTAMIQIAPENRTEESAIRNVFNGILPGTAYDMASNAVYSYPDVITVPMEIDHEAVAESESFIFRREPEPLERKLLPEDDMVIPEAHPSGRAMSDILKK